MGATIAMLVPTSRSCNCSSTSVRPVKTAFLVGTRQTGGVVRGYLGWRDCAPRGCTVSFGG